MAVNPDGLTAAELRQTRDRWWDDSFTALLCAAIPPATRSLVEIGAGLATAARALLPRLAGARYLGIDLDGERLIEAGREISDAGLSPRVSLVRARAESLPLTDGVADVALSVMTLQHIADLATVCAEVRRILRDGGRFVAVEPDNLAQRFYFDAALEGVNQAFARLARAAREARLPADIAVGPRLPRCFTDAGLIDVTLRVHLIQVVAREAAAAYFDRVSLVARTVASSCGRQLGDAEGECQSAIAAARATAGDATGWGVQIVPVFVATAEKPP